MKKKNKQREVKRLLIFSTDFGFVIHASNARPFFPTHTHGLAEMGMPEFIFDPLAFGAKGNANRIIKVYKYLSKPENASQLDDIKHGMTVRLTPKELIPDYTGTDKDNADNIFYVRKVSPDFEGVKLAYFPEDITPGMWFIQISVEGDDYILTDEYYRGGIKW
jgi:hypothetical protein